MDWEKKKKKKKREIFCLFVYRQKQGWKEGAKVVHGRVTSGVILLAIYSGLVLALNITIEHIGGQAEKLEASTNSKEDLR